MNIYTVRDLYISPAKVLDEAAKKGVIIRTNRRSKDGEQRPDLVIQAASTLKK